MDARKSPLRAVLTGVVAAVLLSPAIAVFGLFGEPTWWVLVASFVALVVLVAGAGLLRRRSSKDDESVWNAIPGWQYDGRHVESGGLARGEQEQALQEIQQRAESESGQSR